MVTTQPHEVSIREVIEQEAVEVVFQPIASIRRGKIIGVEALSRGVKQNGGQIPPIQLFNFAAAQGLTQELDRLCRRVAVESFLPLYAADPELILFINVETTAIAEVSVGDESLVNLLQQVNLTPPNVAIEILESKFEAVNQLREAVERNKHYQFLTVLDDVGSGHSNLDRITYIKPDIIKVDRSLVHDLHRNYHKQEVLKALINLAERTGGWVIVEGVEQQEEAIYALDMGADMLQGFYFSRPHKIASNQDIQVELERIHDTASQFKNYTLNKTRTVQAQREQRLAITRTIAAQLRSCKVEEFDHKLTELIHAYPAIESASILDISGVQISDTIRNPRIDQNQKTIIFRPPAKGTNHSLKEYYYLLREAKIDPFETEPYVPLPSENLCITVSTLFEINGESFILCLHLTVDHL